MLLRPCLPRFAFLALSLALAASATRDAAHGQAAPARRPPPAQAETPKAETPPPVVPEGPPPPYEPQLIRLSEVMGTLAFLRDLCGYKDGEIWRKRMSDLIEAEAATPQRKERFAGAYNLGYRGFQQSYTQCTPSARFAIDRYLAEGNVLAHGITGRYGN